MTSSSKRKDVKKPRVYADKVNLSTRHYDESSVEALADTSQRQLEEIGFPKELLEKMGLKK